MNNFKPDCNEKAMMNAKIYFFLLLTLIAGIFIGFSTNASAQETSTIPSWVKNTAKHWVNGDVSDADFIKALQWLIGQGILKIPTTLSTSNGQTLSNSVMMPNNSAHNQAASVYASRMAQYSSSTSTLNTDLIYPPITVGQLWTAYKPTTSPMFSNSKSSVEEIFVNNVVNPPTVVTIDVAEFNTMSGATAAYMSQPSPSGDNIQAFDVKHSNSIVCLNFEKTSGTNISIVINCHLGATVYHISATGGITAEEDVRQFTGIVS
jgi:hypothetical protein